MEIKVNYDRPGELNAITLEEIEEHLVEKRGTLVVWGYKKLTHTKYKIRYGKLYGWTHDGSNWQPVDSVEMHKYSVLEFTN